MATKLFLTNIDLNGNELQKVLLHKLGTEPTGLGTGHIFYDTAVNRAKLLIGTGPDTWQTLGQVDSVAASGSFITIGGTATAPTVAVNNTSSSGGASKIIITDGSGNTSLGAGTISSSTAPTSGDHLTNKTYVDSVAAGLSWKDSARAATTTVLSGTMIANNSSPATGERSYNTTNKTITWFTGEGPTAIDSVTLANTNRVLVKDETATSGPSGGEGRMYNGIYERTSQDVWTRVSDMDSWDEVPSAAVFVEEGTTNADSGWTCTSNQGGTLGTTNIVWAQFNGSTSYTGGDGITITGNSIDIDLVNSNSGLKFTTGELELDLATNGGLTKTGGLQLATSVAGNGLTLTSGVLDVATGNGIQISSDAVAVLLNSNAGLVANTGTGSNELKVNLATSSALALTTNELAVVVDGTTIEINGSNQLAVKAPYAIKKVTGSTTLGTLAGVVTITHNCNSRYVTVQVYSNNAGNPDEQVMVDVVSTGVNTVTLEANGANATYHYVIMG